MAAELAAAHKLDQTAVHRFNMSQFCVTQKKNAMQSSLVSD